MFYERYIDLCKKNSKKPYSVSKELGLSNSNVAQWKKGSSPRPEVINKIAEYFGVSVAYLMGYEQKGQPPAQGGELSEKEVHLISLFRLVPEDRQESLLQTIEFALRSQGLL